MTRVGRVRRPAVAGRFYPADRHEVRDLVDRFLRVEVGIGGTLAAVVAPHAGYVYSGPIAGIAYARVALEASRFARVVLAGPTHHVPLRGLAVPTHAAFRSPLGDTVVDRHAVDALLDLPGVVEDDRPHVGEHSLEVHLPFLQRVLPDRPIVPLAVGMVSAPLVAAVFGVLHAPDTLLIVSTDLSHYLPAAAADAQDVRTAAAIVGRAPGAIRETDACGGYALRGLLAFARDADLQVRELARCTSADTAGDPDRVVGYGAYAVEDAPIAPS